MPALELGDDIGQPELAEPQQQQQVVDEVGCLGRNVRAVLHGRGASSTASSPTFCATLIVPWAASRAV
jgi:hypothetical protein